MAVRHRMLILFRWLVLFVLCHSGSIHAESLRLLILLSSNQAYYQLTANALLQSIDSDIALVTEQKIINDYEFHQGPTYHLIVAIGTRATQKTLQNCVQEPVLSIFIPQSTFQSLVENRPTCPANPTVSAVYLDQPLSRSIDLALQLNPSAQSLGVVLGPASENQLLTVSQLAQQRGLSLQYAVISNQDNPIAVLRPLVEKSDLILPLPDQGPINRAVAKWILSLSFQNKTPVIGFSRAYTEAGAIASVFSSPENIGEHAASLISDWRKFGDATIWMSQFPQDFTLKINDIVSKSLGIALEPAETLKHKIQDLERTR